MHDINLIYYLFYHRLVYKKCVSLAEDLYRTMMSIGFRAQQNGGPDALVETMREIALSSLETRRKNEKKTINFAKSVLLIQLLNGSLGN